MTSCLMLAIALTFAAAADAGKLRVGVVGGGTMVEDDLNKMREARVKSLRIPLSWKGMQSKRPGKSCGSAQYAFGNLDAAISALSRRNIKLLPFFIGSPGYAAASYSNMPKTGTRAFADYKCWVKAVVNRYGRGGTYFRAANDPDAKPITEWQLWNEQNLPNYAARKKVNPREYARFVKATSSTIRGQDKRAKVVLGGMPERSPRGLNIAKFLRKFYKVRRIERFFDVVALHPYAENARGVKGALTRLRPVLRDVGDRKVKIWITETGYATDGRKGHFLVTSEERQAKLLRSTLSVIRKNRTRFKVGTVHWFRWRDQKAYSDNNDQWPNYAGLYRENGTPKPACHAYKRFNGATGNCRSIQSTSSTSMALSAPLSSTGLRSTQVLPSLPE